MTAAITSHRVGLTRSDVAAPKLRCHFRTIGFETLPARGDRVEGRHPRNRGAVKSSHGTVVHVGAVFVRIEWDQ